MVPLAPPKGEPAVPPAALRPSGACAGRGRRAREGINACSRAVQRRHRMIHQQQTGTIITVYMVRRNGADSCSWRPVMACTHSQQLHRYTALTHGFQLRRYLDLL